MAEAEATTEAVTDTKTEEPKEATSEAEPAKTEEPKKEAEPVASGPPCPAATASRKRRNSRRNSRRSSVGKKGIGGIATVSASLEGFYSKDSDATCVMVELHRTGKSYSVRMLKFGENGLKDFVEAVRADETKYIFGCVKVKTKDEEGSVQEKFLYIEVASQVKRIIKTKAFGYRQKVEDLFKTKHLKRILDEEWEKEIVDVKGIESMVKEFLRFGGSDKPTHYDFGGTVWSVADNKVVS